MRLSSRRMVTKIFDKPPPIILLLMLIFFLGPQDERLTGQQGVHTEVVPPSNLDHLETVMSDLLLFFKS